MKRILFLISISLFILSNCKTNNQDNLNLRYRTKNYHKVILYKNKDSTAKLPPPSELPEE